MNIKINCDFCGAGILVESLNSLALGWKHILSYDYRPDKIQCLECRLREIEQRVGVLD